MTTKFESLGNALTLVGVIFEHGTLEPDMHLGIVIVDLPDYLAVIVRDNAREEDDDQRWRAIKNVFGLGGHEAIGPTWGDYSVYEYREPDDDQGGVLTPNLVAMDVDLFERFVESKGKPLVMPRETMQDIQAVSRVGHA